MASRKRRRYLSDRWRKLSDSAIRLSERSLHTCIREKTDYNQNIRPLNLLWLINLGGKLVTTARAVIHLADIGEIDSCTTLRRTFQEALVSICYVLDGTNAWTEKLFERYKIDYKIELYEDMVRTAKIMGKSLDDFIATKPTKYSRYVKFYHEAKKDPVFTIDDRLQKMRSRIGEQEDSLRRISDGEIMLPRDESLIKLLAATVLEASEVNRKKKELRRWRDIPVAEKEMSLDLSEIPHAILTHIRKTGDGAIHSTGPALSRLIDLDSDGNVTLRRVGKSDITQIFEIWRGVTLFLLLGINRILETYHVGEKERERIEKVFKNIAQVKPPKSRKGE